MYRCSKFSIQHFKFVYYNPINLINMIALENILIMRQNVPPVIHERSVR